MMTRLLFCFVLFYTSVQILHCDAVMVPKLPEKIVSPQTVDRPSQKHNGTFVGFTAWKQTIQAYVQGEVIPFSGIILNEGNDYQPNLGVFTCPHDGVYFIAISARKYSSNSLRLEVMHDGSSVMLAYDHYSYNPYNVVTNNAIIRCQQGERIWVEAYSTGNIYGETTVPHSTFTVIMMHQGSSKVKLKQVSEQAVSTRKTQMHQTFNGFTAYTTTTQNYTTGDRIYFSETIFNEGLDYNTTLSRFRCRVTGIYYVMFNLRKYANYPIQIGMEKETTVILHVSDVNQDNYDNVVSNNRLVRCSEGEFLSVKATGLGYVSYIGIPMSTFSAMLMHEEDSNEQQHQSFIGFTAWKKSSQIYEAGETIIFDGVMLNEGDYFKPLLGRFVCPVNGVYYISVTFKRLLEYDLLLDILKGTIPVFQLENTDDLNAGTMVSNSALVRCFIDESITIVAAGSGAVFGDASDEITTFTVMLMSQY